MDETYVRRDADYGHVLEKIGVAILKRELRDASMALLYATTSSYRAKDIASALEFIRGPGLDQVLQAYEMEVDPEALREAFFTWASHRRHHHTLVLSSATIADGSSTAVSTQSSTASV